MKQVHVVYAHPSPRGFTREVLDAFLAGLTEAGHTATVSDLYAMDFRADLTAEEYERESGHRPDAPIPDDVAAEHARLNAADVWAFVYPVWWSDCPARLKGWFDRVWTVGVAYKPLTLRKATQALVLCTAGYSVEQLEADGFHTAMKTVMINDRIGARAERSEFVVFGGSVDRPSRPSTRAAHLARVAQLAREL
ncbi:NAD(P)H-dependent oxidoreductase [Actinocrispum sp. NPDC049592]|uniref:NAD(P)H-dependent oxidoreductase n=1 Tax=Actinocrispum sp. NPDC049592 TaxID=3154835 RepID=UPI0034273E36